MIYIRLIHKTILKIMLFLTILISGVTFSNPVEISFWHSHAGHHGQELQAIADAFNQQQDQYIINPIYKGDYVECLTSLAAAFRAHQAPPLVQIFEVGTDSMIYPEGIIIPVEQLMKKHHKHLNKKDFFPVINSYFSSNGELMAMPLNTSIPTLYFNEDALKSVGLSAHNLPKTWQQLEKIAIRLKEEGYECAFTTANPAWILIEAISAIHGLPMIDEQSHLASYNNPRMLKFITMLKDWQNRGLFEYGGRTDDSSILFTSGRCPLYAQSSGAYNSLSQLVQFKVGMAPLPLNSDITTQRHPNISGGGALWVIRGHDDDVYEGVSQFIEFISQTDIQLRWHRNTGYLPLGITGAYKSILNDSHHPSLLIAAQEFNNTTFDKKEVPARVHNQIRVINEESLESMFAGIKSPSEALNSAVARSNNALSRFKRNTGS